MLIYYVSEQDAAKEQLDAQIKDLEEEVCDCMRLYNEIMSANQNHQFNDLVKERFCVF